MGRVRRTDCTNLPHYSGCSHAAPRGSTKVGAVTDEGVDSINNEAIRKELATFNR